MAAEHEDRNNSVAAQFKEQQRPLGRSKEANWQDHGGCLGLVSQSFLLWCCVSAAVTYVHSLYEIALDYIRIEHCCCFCQVELVTTCQPVTVRTVLLVDHIFLLILMHTICDSATGIYIHTIIC